MVRSATVVLSIHRPDSSGRNLAWARVPELRSSTTKITVVPLEVLSKPGFLGFDCHTRGQLQANQSACAIVPLKLKL